MIYDLLIKGGTLVDPAQGIHQASDVAFSAGKVAAVGPDLPKTESREVIDAGGLIVTPGLIDLHVHVFYGVSHFGVEPDPTCVARGTTTVVDAGSAGADIFPGFRKYVIDVSDTRILAQINISSQGMLTRSIGGIRKSRLRRCRPRLRDDRTAPRCHTRGQSATVEEQHRQRARRHDSAAQSP